MMSETGVRDVLGDGLRADDGVDDVVCAVLDDMFDASYKHCQYHF